MQLGTYLTLYLISIPVFVVLDLLWLGIIAKDFYSLRLSHLLGEVNWFAAIVFYAIFLAGLTYFAIYPAIGGTVYKALFLGAFFGLVTYATYDLTNQATLREWPTAVSVVDILWGMVLGAVVTSVTYYMYLAFFNTDM